MDFIDPKKRRAHKIRLIAGYVLISCAIVMMTLILLYQSYGYGFGKNGQIIQSGLVYISSQPNPASIYLNGVLNSSTTNARLNLPAGEYTVKLTRPGYRPWQRAVGVEGGSVEHFDYPLLIPQNLVTTNLQTFSSQPDLVLQSPNRQWLLIQQPGNDTTFIEYDLSNPKQLRPTSVTIPASLVAANVAGSSWQMLDWSTDNNHILLDHLVNGANNYIVFNRQAPDQSIDLTKTLNLNNTTVPSFNNNHYDQYFLLDSSNQTLSKASLTSTNLTPILEHVISYKSYGGNVFLYVTSQGAPSGSVLVKLLQDSTTYQLHNLSSGASSYLLNLTQYSGNWYVAEGDSLDSKTYIYENPQSVLGSQPTQPLVPVAILKVTDPNFMSFSANAQFILVENGNNFSVFDADSGKMYTYTAPTLVQSGQHAVWMDGDRLMYIGNNGKIEILDYDDANPQALQPAVSNSLDYFDQSYKWTYTIAANASDTQSPFTLTQTSLLIPSDQ